MAAENIFQQYLQPVRSVADYAADMDKSEANALELSAKRAASADEMATRKAYAAGGGDTNKILQLLQQGGQFKAAQAVQKTMQDNQQAQAKIKLDTSHAGAYDQQAQASIADQKYKAATHHAEGLAYIQTPEDVKTYITQGIAKGVFPPLSPEQIQQKLSQYPTVEAFKQAATQAAIPVLDRYKTEAENARNRLNNETSASNNAATNATSRANNASSNATTMRGQNMTDARSRDSNAMSFSKPFEVTGPEGTPVLVRQDKQGNISRVEGFAPKDGSGKMTEDQGKATGWLIQAENAFKNMNGAMTRTPSAAKPGFNDALAAVPMMGGVANSMRGADRQQFIQGASSLSESLLRAATGAGVNRDEAIQKVQELTPVFGEADSTTKQKMAAIPLYIESLKVRAGPGAKKAAGVLQGSPGGSNIDSLLNKYK